MVGRTPGRSPVDPGAGVQVPFLLASTVGGSRARRLEIGAPRSPAPCTCSTGSRRGGPGLAGGFQGCRATPNPSLFLCRPWPVFKAPPLSPSWLLALPATAQATHPGMQASSRSRLLRSWGLLALRPPPLPHPCSALRCQPEPLRVLRPVSRGPSSRALGPPPSPPCLHLRN